MKLTINTAALRSCVDKLAPIAKTRTTVEVLTHLLIQPGPAFTSVMASDGEMYVSHRIDADNQGDEAAFLLPANKLQEFIRNVGGETITIDASGSRVALSSGSARVSVGSPDVKGFPSMPQIKGMAWELRGSGLAAAMDVRFASGAADQKNSFEGVGIVVKGKQRFSVALNGRKMAVLPLGDCDWEDSNHILTGRAAASLGSLFPADAAIQITCDGNAMRFESDKLDVVCRLKEGRVTSGWYGLYNHQPHASALVVSDTLSRACNLARLANSEDRLRTKVEFKADGISLVGDCETTDAAIEIPAHVTGSGSGEYNIDLVRQYLSAADRGGVKLSLVGASDKFLLLRLDGAGGFVGFVSPMGD